MDILVNILRDNSGTFISKEKKSTYDFIDSLVCVKFLHQICEVKLVKELSLKSEKLFVTFEIKIEIRKSLKSRLIRNIYDFRE
jgi:hypothetical protein